MAASAEVIPPFVDANAPFVGASVVSIGLALPQRATMRYVALMPHSAQHEAMPSVRTRWPFLGRPQAMLAAAALITMVASFLPWLDTALFGSVSGAVAGGLYTFYAGLLAFPGVFWRNPRVVAGHLLLLAVADLAIPGWRLLWALRRLPGLGEAWLPSAGMLLLLISGVVAAVAFAKLLPAATDARTTLPPSTRGDGEAASM